MTFPDIDPYVFGLHWGAFGLRWYALAYIAGILLGWLYAVRLVRSPGLWGGKPPATREEIDDLVLYITLGIILGGRLGYVLFYMLPTEGHRAALAADPLSVFKVWEGGMSFHGGLIGVILAVILFARAKKIDLLRLGDAVAPVVPIGLFFGRIANFINGELWGRTTDAPWGVVFCNQRLMGPDGTCAAGFYPRHPSQLYEAALEGVVLFLILLWATHRGRMLQRPGVVTGIFLAGYGLFRMTLENVRNPDAGLDGLPLGLTMGIILSAPMILAGAWLIWRGMKRPPVLRAADEPA